MRRRVVLLWEKIKNLKIDYHHVCSHRSGISVIVAAGMQITVVWIEHVGCTISSKLDERSSRRRKVRAESSSSTPRDDGADVAVSRPVRSFPRCGERPSPETRGVSVSESPAEIRPIIRVQASTFERDV